MKEFLKKNGIWVAVAAVVVALFLWFSGALSDAATVTPEANNAPTGTTVTAPATTTAPEPKATEAGEATTGTTATGTTTTGTTTTGVNENSAPAVVNEDDNNTPIN